MKFHYSISKRILGVILLLSPNPASMAQSISGAEALPVDPPQNRRWEINIAFVPVPEQSKIKQIFLINIEDAKIIKLENLRPDSSVKSIFTATPSEPLETLTERNTGRLEFAKHYELKAAVETDKGDKVLSLGADLELNDPNVAVNRPARVQANDFSDADVYISGELNGARKRQTRFTTETKVQKYNPISASWRYTPYFRLNASTDPDADPDKMDIGLRFRYVTGTFVGIPGAYYDNDVKIESERDFDNSNLIYYTRLTFLPSAFPKGFKTRDLESKIRVNNYKVFLNPFVGAEMGKNLHSPLQEAEGDGIARLLAGADLRLVFFLKKEDEPDIDWTTSYIRRWLLTDELSFEADDNGNLKLRSFGKSPHDYVSSKLSYRINEFFDVFGAYDWGQVPPSYKLVDNRFRLGFAYKYKFGVK